MSYNYTIYTIRNKSNGKIILSTTDRNSMVDSDLARINFMRDIRTEFVINTDSLLTDSDLFVTSETHYDSDEFVILR